MAGAEAEDRIPLPDERELTVAERAGCLSPHLDFKPIGHFVLSIEGSRAILASASAPDDACAFWAASYWLFSRHAACQEIIWELPESPIAAIRDGPLSDDRGWLTRRDLFWQRPCPWLPRAAAGSIAKRQATRNAHLSRPPKPSGQLYRRFDSRLRQWISLRTLDLDRDLERFSRWQNNPRVLRFWQEGGTLEQHRAYLNRLADDPHTLTLIGSFDEEPFAYFEVYWAKEDRIAPFYAAGDHDRGMHMLVGEEHHRGPHKVTSWLSALVHFLFLDEARTQTVVAEPRSDNVRMIDYMRKQGFNKEKEFDFPHKRAALMKLSREEFFTDCALT